jgi:diphosphomevalonate decarboxylase
MQTKKELLLDSIWARSFAPTNIAFAKYWGKRDVELNLPVNSSISACLADYGTFTTVEFNKKFLADSVILNGTESILPLKKVKKVLDLLRSHALVDTRNIFARVITENNFPTGAGLASSASGLCALTLAAAKALGLDLPLEKLSEVSRLGSGSSSRSFFDGYAEWSCGELVDGSDSRASLLMPSSKWPLKAVIAIVDQGEKNKSSTDGMIITSQTSTYYKSWTINANAQLPLIRKAILAKDFDKLGELSELNCLRMHGSAMAAQPPVIYFKPKTLELIESVRYLRNQKNIKCFFTIDAGPNVVIFCLDDTAENEILKMCEEKNIMTLKTKVGPGARILESGEGLFS